MICRYKDLPLIVAIDLQPMAPIEGVIQVQGDITNARTAEVVRIVTYLKFWVCIRLSHFEWSLFFSYLKKKCDYNEHINMTEVFLKCWIPFSTLSLAYRSVPHQLMNFIQLYGWLCQGLHNGPLCVSLTLYVVMFHPLIILFSFTGHSTFWWLQGWPSSLWWCPWW